MRKANRMSLRVLAAVGAILLVTALARANAPAGRYTIVGDTALDNKTHLTWQRTVSAATYTWSGAKQLCVTAGWRLPTRLELQSIVDIRQYNPAIDREAFPNTPSENFWSASSDASYSGYAWSVEFYNGASGGGPVAGYSYRVRCVRSPP